MSNASFSRFGFWVGTGVLGALGLIGACGSPGSIERDEFPGIADVRYTDVPGRNLGVGGSGSTAMNRGGSGGSGRGGSGSVPQAGSGGGSSGGGGNAAPLPTGCTEDPIELMRKPFDQGGCQDPVVGGCHGVGDGEEFPDLLSPGVVDRLLGVPARCDDGPSGLVLIPRGAGDSFFVSKMEDNPPICGDDQMPAFPADPNSAASRAVRTCLTAWVQQVAAGGN